MSLYCGREFSSHDIQAIKLLMQEYPSLKRTPMSRKLCEMFEWRKPNGELKDMTCRVALSRMQSDGLVTTYLEESSSGPPRKYYQLTKAGRAALIEQKADWTEFTASVARILTDAKPGSQSTRAVGGVT